MQAVRVCVPGQLVTTTVFVLAACTTSSTAATLDAESVAPRSSEVCVAGTGRWLLVGERAAMNRAFRRRLNTTPGDHRRHFGQLVGP